MTAPRLTFQDGKLVIKDGKAATGEGCCCGGVCCGPDCGAIFPVDFLPDAGMDAAFTAFLSGRGYSNIEYFEEPGPQFASWTADCCKTDESDTDSFEITGTINGNPTSLTVTVALCVSTKAEGTSCAEGLTAEECESLGGTVSDAATCDPDPCACPGGGPGLGTLNPNFCGDYSSCCTETGCVPATYFMADVADCICYTDDGQVPGNPGVYATYAECCAENFCPEPPP